MRSWAQILVVLAGASRGDDFSTGVRSSYSDLHHFEDAELYLSSVGIPTNLPQLARHLHDLDFRSPGGADSSVKSGWRRQNTVENWTLRDLDF